MIQLPNRPPLGEILISAVSEKDLAVGSTSINGSNISDYQELADGSIEIHLNPGSPLWVIQVPKNENIQRVDLLLYPKKDSMLSKFPLTSKRSIEFDRLEPLFNVTVVLPDVLVFPAPKPF